MHLLLITQFLAFLTLVMANFFAPPSSSTPPLGPQLEPWHPESKFETFGSGQDVSDLIPAGEVFDAKKVSIAFLAKRYSLDPDTLFYRNGYEDDITKHAFVGEIHDGIPFSNEVSGHVVFNRHDKVVSVSSSLVTITTASISSSTPTISLQEAIKSAEETLHGTFVPSSSTASVADTDKEYLEYLANENGSATLVFALSVSNDSEGTSFLAYVDAHKGAVVAAVNYVAQ
ncbi:hypothetical protein D9756_002110 [Leucocoprinus leucothites]|uniref:FTP domain-containing protein n=1 Tax=Leucocoprinus leucothites TaxID=201217 RepID=A0A8H5GC26_9AGAR|nr:hypothetical protein D9756_002110 [Leucoagaricus leucothites]